MKPKPLITKLLTILISILLVIQPLSGCIADFSFDSLNSKNKNLSKEQKEILEIWDGLDEKEREIFMTFIRSLKK